MVGPTSKWEDATVDDIKCGQGDFSHGLKVVVIEKLYLTSHGMNTINTVVTNHLQQLRKFLLTDLGRCPGENAAKPLGCWKTF